MKVIKISEKAVDEAVLSLKKGGVVIFPTDTVYGFLADAQNKKAVDKIFKIKKRPKSKPLSIFVKDIKVAKELAVVDERAAKIFLKFWPGKYTFILKRKPNIKLYGVKRDTIAVRIPKYKFLNDLLNKINRPLVQTSVNFSRQEPLNNIKKIIENFKDEKRIGLIIDGDSLKKPKSSKIIDLSKNKIRTLR